MLLQLLPSRPTQSLLLFAVALATTSVVVSCRYYHDRYMLGMGLVSLVLVALSSLPADLVESSDPALIYICRFVAPLDVAFLLMKLGSGLHSWDELAYPIQVMAAVSATCLMFGVFVDMWRRETRCPAVQSFTWRAVPMG